MAKHSLSLHCGAHGLGSVPSCLSLLPSPLPEGVPGMDTLHSFLETPYGQ